MGRFPDDFHLFGGAEAEDPLRAILNPNDDWVYPIRSVSYPSQIPRVLAEIEQEIENSRSALQVPAPKRLSPFVRYTMSKRSDFDFWSSFFRAFETLGAFWPKSR